MKKLAAVLLAGVMCLSLAACGSDSADEAVTSDAEAAVEETTEDAEAAEDAAAEDTEGAEADAAAGEVTTVTEGVLTMGTNAAFPPYEYYEGDEIVGIDAEIAQALAEKLGLTLEIVDMDFNSIVTAVQSGKIDVGIAGMTVDPDRQKNVDFTDSYAHFFPSAFTFENYVTASANRYFPRYALNSIITSLMAAFFRLIVTTMAAFAFTHLSFKGKKVILIMLLSTLFIPYDAILFQNYSTIARAGLIDTYWGIILPSVFSASSLLFMIGAFSSYDRDVYDAARLDGAGDIRYITGILIHLTAAVSATVFIQTFITGWVRVILPG